MANDNVEIPGDARMRMGGDFEPILQKLVDTGAIRPGRILPKLDDVTRGVIANHRFNAYVEDAYEGGNTYEEFCHLFKKPLNGAESPSDYIDMHKTAFERWILERVSKECEIDTDTLHTLVELFEAFTALDEIFRKFLQE